MKYTNSNKILGAVSIFSLALSYASAGLTQTQRKTVTTRTTTQRVTVGQMLKKAQSTDRGGKANLSQKTNTVLPQSQFNFQKPKENVDLSSVKPPRTSDILRGENNNQIEYEKTLDVQINELFKLTQKYKQSSNRGELWLRLAELYVEKAGLVDSRKQNEYDQKLKDFQAGKTKIKPKLDTAQAREYNKKAIQLYDWFQRDYPRDPKMAQALFFLGYNYFEIGDYAKGTHFYSRLTKEHPNSPFVGEAHFALAENYFETEKWADAYKEYAYLIKNRKHRLHTFAMYKGGWCLFRLGKTQQAIQYLDYIVKNGASQNADESIAGKKLNSSRLEGEALRDLVVFYADLGDTKKAINYFRGINNKEAKNYIEKLAYYYADKGNREGSREVFRMLIDQDPTSKKAFEYQYQIVQNYFYAKNSPSFKEELYRWTTDFGPNSQWYAANKSDEAFMQNSYKLREQTLRNYIMQQHQTAQNSRAAFSQQNALQGYRLYFQEFPDSPNVADMHFLYGELLYDMNKFQEASNEYTWVAEKAPNSKYGAKASQNLLLAIEKALPKDEELQKRVGDSVEPIAMDPRVEKFIRSANWYVQKYPNTEKDAEIKFRVGRLYYQTNNFAPAEKQFKEIVQKHPKTKYAEYSANLLLDIYNLKKDYAGLEKMGTELLANESIAGTKAGSEIRGVLEKANFKKAQDLEGQRKFGESAQQYQTFYEQNPKSELATMALFNAGVNFERAGNNADAIKNYKRVVQAHDKQADSLRPKAQKLLAKLYQDSGLFEESASLFKQIAKENPKDPLTPNYIYNAAVMYEALGRNNEAIANYREFININKKQSENANALFSIAQIQRKTGQKWPAANSFKEYVDLPHATLEKKAEALYWLSSDLPGKREDKDQAKDRVLGFYRRSSGDIKSKIASYAAKIKFKEAETTYAELKSVRIPADPAKQKAAVDRKLETLNRLNAQLTEIVKYDSAEEIVSSLNLLGEANQHMANSIRGTPIPGSLKEEQRKQYMEGIEKIAEPFANKAKDSYKLAVDRGRDLDVFNASYKNALKEMERKSPNDYPARKEIGMDSRLINWMGER